MSQGIVLMVVGMTSVFFLLTLLVGLMLVAAKFFSSWPLDEEPEALRPPKKERDELELIALALAAAERSRT